MGAEGRRVKVNGELVWVYPPRFSGFQDLLDYTALVVKLVEKGLLEPERAEVIGKLLERAGQLLQQQVMASEVFISGFA